MPFWVRLDGPSRVVRCRDSVLNELLAVGSLTDRGLTGA